MKRVRTIFQWIVGIVVGVYLAALVLMNLPVVQRWLGRGVAMLLEEQLDTRVEVGRVEIGWNGRILVDDLAVWDHQGEEMLRVARLGARVGIRDLMKKRIRIGNAQIFGMHALLYQDSLECAPNFKFLIDAFASKDTTSHTPLNLRVSQLLVRRGNIRWEQRWKPDTTAVFSPAHLDVEDLNLTAQLNCLTDDSINLRVKRLDFREHRSGLCVKTLTFDFASNHAKADLTELNLQLPETTLEGNIHTDGLSPFHAKFTSESLYRGRLKVHVSPQDLKPLLSRLPNVDNTVDFVTDFAGQGESLTVNSLQLRDGKGLLYMTASGTARHFLQGKDSISAHIDFRDLYAESELLSPYLENNMVNRIGSARLSGNVEWVSKELSGDLAVRTPLGDLALNGCGRMDGFVDMNVQSEGFQLGSLLNRTDLGLLAMEMKTKGNIRQPSLALQGFLREVDYRGYRYRNVSLDGELNQQRYKGQIGISDVNISLDAEGDIDLRDHRYQVKANIEKISPNLLNITKRYADTQFSGEIIADISGRKLEDMSGTFQLNRFCMTDSTGTYRPGDIHITSQPDDGSQHMRLVSPFLEAQVEGNFEPKVLVAQVARMVSQYLPTQRTEVLNQGATENVYGQASFTVRAYSAEPLRRLLDIPLELDGTTTANGQMDSGRNALWLTLSSPNLRYGGEELRNIDLRLESNYNQLLASAQMQRLMKGQYINCGIDTQGHDGKLTSRLYWNNESVKENNPEATTYAGDISLISRIFQTPSGGQGFEGEILPSSLIVSDTLWSVHPGFVSYYDDMLRVDSFQISKGDHFVSLCGRASKEEGDTLHAQLRKMNLEYIFSLINFHAVELTGEATGDVYAHSLLSAPKADAYLRIPQFSLNYGTMGDLDVHLNWGRQPYSIYMNGEISDTPNKGRTFVEGYITPKKDVEYHGLDLNVRSERVNLYFINKWTSGIFDNLQGRASGWIHIFGPFKGINIEGEALVNEAAVTVPSIGVRYHVENDSVHLQPGNIYFSNARLYDPQGSPQTQEHSGLVTGRLHHDNFKNMSYDISIQGRNMLAYDFRDFGDMPFYGTVFGTGDITLKGHPGLVNIGIKATPERGTAITYNATSPDKITETPFITYRAKAFQPSDSGGENAETGETREAADPSPAQREEASGSSDLFIDFDLDIDNRATMNLLMDAQAGDKITLNGRGRMLAHYYNKGSFSLFGTYRVERGTYNLSLQEVIHKNFEFSDGGTLVFNGDPYEADLNLQAVHTVSGVSLNDINPKANFSNNSARVNCLMNIGGKAREPRITFDFDILNANEEEKQMVRSLISTEEERNMQVIYLLGIGRFYAYDYANENQTQGTMAMNSLLASTLSGTINQALSNMMGTTNWNFGANLRTGEMGWSDMDVEGMLQGNLLNNRLLINGNFGYRDNPVATSNFIGDFDVKYLLTRSGSVALKAYSETNDRYFTKSSLTTQGIGVLLKKDFSSWRDLIGKRKRGKREMR